MRSNIETIPGYKRSNKMVLRITCPPDLKCMCVYICAITDIRFVMAYVSNT